MAPQKGSMFSKIKNKIWKEVKVKVTQNVLKHILVLELLKYDEMF